MKDEQLDLQCEWRDCDYVTCNLDQFVRHVSLHIPHLEVKVNEDQEGNGSVVYPRILPASISIDDETCRVIHLLISTPVRCSNISEDFIGLKIGKNKGTNNLDINTFHAMNRLGCIKIATAKQIGLISVT
jgi:hypothetical protein